MGASVATRVEALVPALLALTSAFAVITLGLWCTGASALNIFSALLTGAAGDQYRLTETLVKACPLLYTGLAVTLALHAGVWNIGAEGQLPRPPGLPNPTLVVQHHQVSVGSGKDGASTVCSGII